MDRLDRVRLQFEMAEEDLLWIQPGTTAYIRFPQADPELVRAAFADYLIAADASAREDAAVREPGPLLKTEVAAVFPAEDPKTHTGTVEVRLPNPNAVFKTNTYVVADFVKRRVDKAIAIPKSALPPDGSPVVFVGPASSEEGAAERRKVKLGLVTEDQAQVLEGIHPGEFVITKGQRALTSGQTVRVVHREGRS